MTLEELVTLLRDQNVRIYDEDNAFRLQAPKGVLTSQLLEVITGYQADLLYLVRVGDVRVCPARAAHRPQWRYAPDARVFVCCACRNEAIA